MNDITWKLFKKRFKFWGRIHRLPELIEFYDAQNIKANFFFGLSNALGLSYSNEKAKKWINFVLENEHNAGVHGISYKNEKNIHQEFSKFKNITGLDSFGIRTHYLRLSGFTHNLFDKQGYMYDSSIDCIMAPFKVNNMHSIPISIMDVSLVNNAQLNQNLDIWKNNTLKRLELAKQYSIPYFVVNFHDLYYSDQFPVMRDWFVWLINLLKEQKYEFTTFEKATFELNNK